MKLGVQDTKKLEKNCFSIFIHHQLVECSFDLSKNQQILTGMKKTLMLFINLDEKEKKKFFPNFENTTH